MFWNVIGGDKRRNSKKQYLRYFFGFLEWFKNTQFKKVCEITIKFLCHIFFPVFSFFFDNPCKKIDLLDENV